MIFKINVAYICIVWRVGSQGGGAVPAVPRTCPKYESIYEMNVNIHGDVILWQCIWHLFGIYVFLQTVFLF